jgi:uroporphyrin-3 C-methyltransferase
VSDVPAPPPRRHGRVGFWLLLLLLLALAGWRGWHWWQARSGRALSAASDTTQQLQALDARIDSLRRDLRAQSQRLQQADATNRVLRDELIGVGQRAALLEDSVRKLAEPGRDGAQALRLDEVELLLTQASARLELAGDLDGARRAYALAAGVLDGVDDPALLDLRQTLAQERAALDAACADPRLDAVRRLDAFAAALALPALPAATQAGAAQPWWRRTFAQLVQVRPSEQALVLDSGARAAAFATLQLDLALARTAVERRDQIAYAAALARADGDLARLWTGAPLRTYRGQLQALRALPLRRLPATFGSTLQQLQARRAAH